MDRFSGANFVTIGGLRFFVDFNPNTNAPGSVPNSLWMNGAQESILAPVIHAGLVPTDADNTQLLQAIKIIPPGRLLNIQVFTASGTYTPTAGTNSVDVEVQGAGGGSDGIPAVSSSGAGFAPSGGAGAYGRGWYTAGFSGATVTIGAAGAAGPVGGGGAGNGGTSSFGTLLTAPGGNAGTPGIAATTFPSNSSVAAKTALPTGANIISARGSNGTQVLMVTAGYGSGFGAVAAGEFGLGPGAGAAGNYSPPLTAAVAGTAGQTGIVIVREYS